MLGGHERPQPGRFRTVTFPPGKVGRRVIGVGALVIFAGVGCGPGFTMAATTSPGTGASTSQWSVPPEGRHPRVRWPGPHDLPDCLRAHRQRVRSTQASASSRASAQARRGNPAQTMIVPAGVLGGPGYRDRGAAAGQQALGAQVEALLAEVADLRRGWARTRATPRSRRRPKGWASRRRDRCGAGRRYLATAARQAPAPSTRSSGLARCGAVDRCGCPVSLRNRRPAERYDEAQHARISATGAQRSAPICCVRRSS